MKRILKKVCLLAAVSSLLLSGCKGPRETLVVAEQYGLAYAPVTVMKEKGFLQEALPDVAVEWKQMANTAAIREAMVAGDLDAGFVALPPFFIGADKGMEWKVMCGLSEMPLGLVSLKPDRKTLADFGDKDRIALPQPGSIQHILLSMASERLLGDASAFDTRLVTMTHPDGLQALLAGGDITAHFTSPPYLFMEMDEPGATLVLTGTEAMGEPFTFVAGVSTDAFSERYPERERALVEALGKTMAFMEEQPGETAEILSQVYGLEAGRIRNWLSREDMVYTLEIRGMETFHAFMMKRGLIGDLRPLEDLVRRHQP